MDISDLQRGDFEYIFIEKGILAWLLVFAASFAITTALKFLVKIVSSRLMRFAKHTAFVGDNIFASCLSQTRTWFIAAWVFVPLALLLESSQGAVSAGRMILIVASSFQIIIWLLQGILEWRNLVWQKKVERDASSAAAFGLVYSTLKALIIVGVIMMALSNLGVNIGAMITGLGIGGVAVALAAQNVLGDLFASLSIVLDKPFVVGDYIVSGQEEGTVETIGVKTTRVRSISGEELIFSNKDLLDSRIRNYKRMWQRRVVQKFSVNYDTPLEKVKNIPGWVKEIFPQYKKLKFDRCHLTGYNETALNFELVFWVTDTDYNLFMDLQQGLLLDIFTKFEKEEIDLGFPVRAIRFEDKLQDLPFYARPEGEFDGKAAENDFKRPQPNA